MGPIVTGVQGLFLTSEEKDILAHPLISGVILFTRNYHDKQQLKELVRQIRACKQEPILICVDQEGGRVQRFRSGFTPIPAMASFEALADDVKFQAAQDVAWLLASELRECDIDFSFTPVLDLQINTSVIGSRSFSRNKESVVKLAEAFIRGLEHAGMPAIGKHFPGHGSVKEDSHVDMPVDKRLLKEITESDLVPFAKLIQAPNLLGMMPAHVIYSNADPMPACFSPFWLQTVLRTQLAFNGVIISDDMGMQGALQMGKAPERVVKALQAGCELILMCNEMHDVIEVLDHLSINQFQDHGSAAIKLKSNDSGFSSVNLSGERATKIKDMCKRLENSEQ